MKHVYLIEIVELRDTPEVIGIFPTLRDARKHVPQQVIDEGIEAYISKVPYGRLFGLVQSDKERFEF
jgi:hypothetical protein